MHELGIVYEIQKRVEQAAKENGFALADIASVVVEVGEASTIIPRYLSECWPAATDGTDMASAALEIEVIPAEVSCNECGALYEYLKNDRRCPCCGALACTMVRGQELNIREITVYDDGGEDGPSSGT
jgi:hydrogenase nickel incorporation protein HypA/HybF